MFHGNGFTQLGDAGFNDWKNGHLVIFRHENSLAHKNNTLSFITLQSDVGRIDTQLATQVTDEMNYWKAVLHRVVEVIKFLGAKGLSFRGDNEQFNKINNGNFLGTLELLAKYDPFIAQHIEKYGNRGKETPSYLSSTIYEKPLLLMKNDIIKIILKELKAAQYYSLIVDSTPDIANVDQLVIALRYVLPSGVPAERFLIVILNSGHKSEEMSNVVMDFPNSHNIPIENCRGQSYDNARNMSGQYSGLQSRIKSFNSFAEYVLCSAHSLNLVGTCAAESCNSSTSFFMLLQELYTFFSSSIKKKRAKADKSRSQPLTEITGKIDFIRNVYYVIIDTLKCQPSSRRQAYEKISDIYGCMPTLYKTPSSIVVRNTCETLAKYFIDVENSSLLLNELNSIVIMSWCQAVWLEGSVEEELMIPPVWIERAVVKKRFVRWPIGMNVIKACNQQAIPQNRWFRFPLFKKKCRHSK
nr:zinc finger MYM-type protein 1-like [Hydra vulgaris]